MKLQLVLTVNYDDSPKPDRDRLIRQLEGVASHAAGYGLLSGEGEETVDWWSAKVLELPDQAVLTESRIDPIQDEK